MGAKKRITRSHELMKIKRSHELKRSHENQKITWIHFHPEASFVCPPFLGVASFCLSYSLFFLANLTLPVLSHLSSLFFIYGTSPLLIVSVYTFPLILFHFSMWWAVKLREETSDGKKKRKEDEKESVCL